MVLKTIIASRPLLPWYLPLIYIFAGQVNLVAQGQLQFFLLQKIAFSQNRMI